MPRWPVIVLLVCLFCFPVSAIVIHDEDGNIIDGDDYEKQREHSDFFQETKKPTPTKPQFTPLLRVEYGGKPEYNKDLVIDIYVKAYSEIGQASFYLRKKGKTNFGLTRLEDKGTLTDTDKIHALGLDKQKPALPVYWYQVTIPDILVTEPGLEYYLYVRDKVNNPPATYGTKAQPVFVAIERKHMASMTQFFILVGVCVVLVALYLLKRKK